jgi:capsular exopolysaccharide synthesis family protein
MSRIQDILNKAERDGTARRTRGLSDEYASGPAAEGPQARSFVDSAPPALSLRDDARLRSPELPRVTPPGRVGPAAPDARQPDQRREPLSPAAPPAGDRSGYDDARIPDAHYTTAAYAPLSEGAPRVVADMDHHLVAALAPTSLAAEQYRSLRTRLKRVESGRALRTIAITSPNKGDGKSLTAANLALTMAQEFQQRVLLLDCDLRRPTVHRLFGLSDGPGLGDVLMNGAELDQALVALPEYHLTVMPAGLPPSRPAELLGSAAMRRVLDTLRARFDRILIDVPPVAPLADLHILAPMVDGLLMIVRAGVTPKPAIERALAGLDAAKVLGLVLNESGGETTDSYNYEGYGYVAG